MKHTMETIAELAGVSRATVSLVANNSPKVKEETRRKVLDVFKRVNYRPNAAARALVSKVNGNIGIAFHDISYISDLVFNNILVGAMECADSLGYNVVVCSSGSSGQPNNGLYFKKLVDENRIDGLVVYDTNVPDSAILEVRSSGFPVILVERELKGDGNYHVHADDVDGMRQLTEYLIGLGHERIGYISGAMRYPNVPHKLEGYRSACESHGISYSPLLVKFRPYKKAAEAFPNLVAEVLDESATALILDNDSYVPELLDILSLHGLRVPEDVSVAGYTDSLSSSLVRPQMTSVRVPYREIGRQAVRMLLQVVQEGMFGECELKLKAELVVRDSCRAINSDAPVGTADGRVGVLAR